MPSAPVATRGWRLRQRDSPDIHSSGVRICSPRWFMRHCRLEPYRNASSCVAIGCALPVEAAAERLDVTGWRGIGLDQRAHLRLDRQLARRQIDLARARACRRVGCSREASIEFEAVRRDIIEHADHRGAARRIPAEPATAPGSGTRACGSQTVAW